MPALTITPGVLKVASAFPDPPFEVEPDTGFDAELMQRICATLGLTWQLVTYDGQDFNGIFDGLGRDYDAVISGTTVTPAREKVALFCTPYAAFNQGVAVSTARHPGIRSVAGAVNAISAKEAVAEISFEQTAAGSSRDWHNAPCRQYVITLSGTLEFKTRSGVSSTVRPGDVLLADDATGGCHRWQLTDGDPCRRVYVGFA